MKERECFPKESEERHSSESEQECDPEKKKNCIKQFVTLNREFALFIVNCISSFGCLNMMVLGEVGLTWHPEEA